MLSTPRLWPRFSGLAALASVALASLAAQAAPPSQSDFRILYFITDENGERGRQMSQQDMELFVNQARCQCNQKIITRITFQGSGVDPELIVGMVGQFCDDGQRPNTPYDLCAQIVSGLPQTFQTNPEYVFDPIWLAYGVQGNNQNIDTAIPVGTCDGGQSGQGGLWMCAGVTNCQQGNFFMSGTYNANILDGNPAAGIAFDYLSPVSPPTDFAASPGDSAVEISWKNLAPGDIAGYRILCADAAGNPIDNGVKFTRPSATSIVNGTIYYTQGNLCPNGPFDALPGGDGDGDGDPDCTPGDAGCECLDEDVCTNDVDDVCVDGLCCTLGDNDCTCDAGAPMGEECAAPGASCNAANLCECPDGAEDCACIGGVGVEGTCNEGLGCNDAGVCKSGILCPTGSQGCACFDDNTCNVGLECDGASNTCATPTDGIYTLDWSYVCSDHLGFNSTRARVGGLQNGTDYTFLVVAYDRAGNPVYGETVTARPVPTNGLWEQCEAQGNLCGDGWNCSVVDRGQGGWLLGGLGLAFGGLGLGLVARRRRRRS
jgi:hypothetical protein